MIFESLQFYQVANFRVENNVVLSSILNEWKIATITHGSYIFHEATEATAASLVSEFLDFQQFYIKLGAAFLYVYLIDHKQTVCFSQGGTW